MNKHAYKSSYYHYTKAELSDLTVCIVAMKKHFSDP